MCQRASGIVQRIGRDGAIGLVGNIDVFAGRFGEDGGGAVAGRRGGYFRVGEQVEGDDGVAPGFGGEEILAALIDGRGDGGDGARPATSGMSWPFVTRYVSTVDPLVTTATVPVGSSATIVALGSTLALESEVSAPVLGLME